MDRHFSLAQAGARRLTSRVSYRSSRGFTLVEMVVALCMIGVLMMFVGFNFKAIENEAQNGASELIGFLKKSRAKALTSTASYTITPVSSTLIRTTYSTSCSGAQTNDPSLSLELPTGAHLESTVWSVCYSSRGLSDSSVNIVISDDYRSKTVQVVLGGGARIL